MAVRGHGRPLVEKRAKFRLLAPAPVKNRGGLLKMSVGLSVPDMSPKRRNTFYPAAIGGS